MIRTYVVQMPKAEARYLAGLAVGWPATPEARCVHAVREWLDGLRCRRSGQVPVEKVISDLELILDQVPPAERPVCGPFAAKGGLLPPGLVKYLGDGAVRLDDAAISTLAGLREGDDFRVTQTDAGPVLSVGNDRYLAREDEPGALPPLPRRVRRTGRAQQAEKDGGTSVTTGAGSARSRGWAGQQ